MNLFYLHIYFVLLFSRVGTINTVMECTVEKKVSEQSSMSAAVSIGVPSGVILKIK